MQLSSILLSAMLLAADAPAQHWPGFLGAGASPIEPASIPLNWSPTENISWKTKLPGKGQSSPVIWNDRVFVTCIDGSMKEHCFVVAINLRDGSIEWKQDVEGTQKIRSNYFQCRSAPTPVVDDRHVYAFFETGDVVAYTHEGELVWQRSLTADYGEFESTIGVAASPIQTGSSVIILADHEGPSYLVALDKPTGRTIWQTERTSRVSYSSPALVPIGNTTQVVCSSSGTIDGYDPDTGRLLWTHEGVGGNRSSTPLPFGDGTFLVGASPGMHGEREEEAKKSNFAMVIESSSDTFSPKIRWATEKAMPAFASPIVYAGHAYWVNRVGIVHCFDAETPLSAPLRGTSSFAVEFPVQGPRDGQGRSLRDLDLTRRLFQYPCSYMVYSESFQRLPSDVKSYIARRFSEILRGQDTSAAFSHLSADDRRAILDILRETIPDVVETEQAASSAKQ